MRKRTLNVKKSTYRRRRRAFKKRRSVGAKIARSMQNKALSYVKKKYTAVQPIKIAGTAGAAFLTVSHIGGVNTNSPTIDDTVTIKDCNPDGMLDSDMKLYQFFRITGVSIKIFWPEGTDVNNTPVQWSMAYSSNLIIKPDVAFERLQSLQTYMTSSCDSSKPVSRYFKTAGSLKRLGIDWSPTSEINLFKPTAPIGQLPLYGKQLQPNSGSSTNFKFYRAGNSTAAGEIGRI